MIIFFAIDFVKLLSNFPYCMNTNLENLKHLQQQQMRPYFKSCSLISTITVGMLHFIYIM